MVMLLLWPVAGAAFVLRWWVSLGREQSSVAAYETGLRQLEAVARRAGDGTKRLPVDPMPAGHVRMLPKETTVLAPARRRRRGPAKNATKRSAAERRRLGIPA